MSIRLLRRYIREQAARIGGLGSRNVFTHDDSPYTWEDLPGYDVDISPNVNGRYSLTVFFNGKQLTPSLQFNDYEEANHKGRMIVDKHRVKSGQEEEA
tara:strand:- start:313 stop:606 length:294 start_codon:yes stop_codon:yes gene_type:complete